MKRVTAISFGALSSGPVLAHDNETTSSMMATLVHQLTAPDHLLMTAVVVAGIAFMPSVIRRIRNKK